MAKKKTNPNKIPIAADSYDIEQITIDATNRNVLKGWTLIFGAFASLNSTTTEGLVDLWEKTNTYSTTILSYDDVADSLKYIEKIADIRIPFEQISTANIKTKGDLDKFIKRANQNALYAAFAIIAEPIIKEKMLPKETISALFSKAYDLEQEILQKRITLQDILDMLEDEYSICLTEWNNKVKLIRMDGTDNQTTNEHDQERG